MAENPTLRKTVELRRNETPFNTEQQEAAAEELVEFYEDGVRTFTEMEERGEWSRSMFQKVYHTFFEGITPDDEQQNGMSHADTGEGYSQGFKDGFSAGVEWARENPDVIRGPDAVSR